MSLYPDQLKAAEEFEHWLNNTTIQTCGLWASAGFGKSYSALHMIDEVIIKNSNYIPLVCSMTHSAVAVLKEFVGREVTTLHSLMGWIPYVDKETGEEGLSTPRMRDRNAEPRFGNNHILLVDEAGLMGHTEVRLLLEELELTGARVMFIGDHKQCYPVTKEHEKLCIPSHDHAMQHGSVFELTIPKRTDDDNMIFKLATKYREAVDGADQPKLQTALNSDGKTGVRIVDDLEDIAIPAFKAGIRDGDVHKIKCLCFTNKRALTLNRKIRKRVLGLKSPIPTVGEEMVANTSISESAGDGIMIRNNEKLIVREVEETSSHGLEGAFIQFDHAELDPDGNYRKVAEVVFVPATPAKLIDRMKKLSNDAKAFKANGFEEEARQALTKLDLEAERIRVTKSKKEQEYEQFSKELENNAQQVVQQPRPQPSDKALAWAEKNTWFRSDADMTDFAQRIHRGLVAEGFDTESDDYYDELTNRVKNKFPESFKDSDQTIRGNTIAQPVASATRSATPGRKSVKLTASQVKIAKKLGVPLAEYAKYV